MYRTYVRIEHMYAIVKAPASRAAGVFHDLGEGAGFVRVDVVVCYGVDITHALLHEPGRSARIASGSETEVCMITREELGERIATARQEAKMNQASLAAVLGVDRAAVSRIESGSRNVDSIELATIAEAVGHPVSWFLEERMPVQALFLRETQSSGEDRRAEAAREIERFVSDLTFLRGLED